MLVVLKVGSFVVPYYLVDYFGTLTEMLRFATGDLVFAGGFQCLTFFCQIPSSHLLANSGYRYRYCRLS